MRRILTTRADGVEFEAPAALAESATLELLSQSETSDFGSLTT